MKAITNLNTIRTGMGYTVPQFAEELGLSQGTIRSWERGGRIQTRKLEIIEDFVTMYNEENGTDFEVKTADCGLNQFVPVEGSSADTPAAVTDTQSVTYEEAEEAGASVIKKAFGYIKDDSDNPVIERFFGHDWTIGDVICNTDVQTLKQFISEYENAKNICPEDVVSMRISGGKHADYAVLRNDNGLLTLYGGGEILTGILATNVYKQKDKKWGIYTVA